MKRMTTERGLDRLVNFSDATVAIAITLLILPLVEVAGDLANGAPPAELLLDHWSSFMGFLITFAVIGRFWATHHRIFELVAGYDGALIWANFLWLASIVFLAFAASALANVPIENAAVIYIVYIGTMVVASFAIILIEIVLLRGPHLLRPEAVGSIRLSMSIVPTALFVLALLLAALYPIVGMFWLLLLFLAIPINRVIARTRDRSPDRDRLDDSKAS